MQTQLPNLNQQQKAIIYDMIHKKMNEQLKLMRQAEEDKHKKTKFIKTASIISILSLILFISIMYLF